MENDLNKNIIDRVTVFKNLVSRMSRNTSGTGSTDEPNPGRKSRATVSESLVRGNVCTVDYYVKAYSFFVDYSDKPSPDVLRDLLRRFKHFGIDFDNVVHAAQIQRVSMLYEFELLLLLNVFYHLEPDQWPFFLKAIQMEFAEKKFQKLCPNLKF